MLDHPHGYVGIKRAVGVVDIQYVAQVAVHLLQNLRAVERRGSRQCDEKQNERKQLFHFFLLVLMYKSIHVRA